MKTNPLNFCFCALIALMLVPASWALADKPNEPARQPVKSEEVGKITRDKADEKTLPEGHFFTEAQAFAKWWEKLELDAKDIPEVDFKKSIVLIQTRDAADPNRVSWSAMMNEKGELELMGMTTLIGFQPSEEIEVTFLAIEREGVTGVVRYEWIKKDHGKRERVRKVYPVEKAEPQRKA